MIVEMLFVYSVYSKVFFPKLFDGNGTKSIYPIHSNTKIIQITVLSYNVIMITHLLNNELVQSFYFSDNMSHTTI